jgi:hypothetical protein
MPYSNIDKPNSYFNTVTYAGNSATNNISVGFEPDFVWIKNRTYGLSHYLNDSVRGAYKTLFSNTTSAEYDGTSNSDGVSAFTSTGFTLLNGTNVDNYNKTANNYVAWNWRGSDSSAVSNTAGSITSTVSANTTSGFSIVSYTGTGANATVGHGLGVAPKMIIIKCRSSGFNWAVWQKDLGGGDFSLQLNTNIAKTNSFDYWNGDPTSTVFTLGTDNGVNQSTQTFIAYCFADVKGYSKFSSYTGNGSADGSFTYCGFSPALVILKRTDSDGFNWVMSDNKRNTYNPIGTYLHPNLSSEDGIGSRDIDFLSNGFKIRNSNTTWNASGGTYIYMAFAENPFVSSKAIPTTAR